MNASSTRSFGKVIASWKLSMGNDSIQLVWFKRNCKRPIASERLSLQDASAFIHPPMAPPMTSKHSFDFASVPWYTESTYYSQFRAFAIDSDCFFSTFQEWLTVALEHARQAERNGITIIRIRMFPQPFKQWCELSGARNNAAGRSAYAQHCAEKLLPQ